MKGPVMIALSHGKRASGWPALVGAALMVALTLLAPPARAQPLTAADYTTFYRWDELRRMEMKIGPDPDGTGPLKRRAEKYAYDAENRLLRTDIGTTTSTTGSDFAIEQSQQSRYDAVGNKTQTYAYRGTEAAMLTQVSYDAGDRPICTAVRMNRTLFDALYAGSDRPDACVLSATDMVVPDRITQNVYDPAGQVTDVRRGLGTLLLQTWSHATYTANGQRETVRDANSNRTTFVYDGHDRLVRQRFPLKSVSLDTSSDTDFEAYDYDPNGNRTLLRKRDTKTFTYEYDALDRQIVKRYPVDATKDVYTSYDLMGRPLSARFQNPSDPGVVSTYDAVGRRITETTGGLTVGSDYNAASLRWRVTWPGNASVEYDYDAAGHLTVVREPGGGLAGDKLAGFTYDDLGRRGGGALVGGAVQTTYEYDPAGRLNLLRYLGFPGGGQAIWQDTIYTPASQVETVTQHNPALVWTGQPTTTVAYVANGLNQDAAIATLADGYDPNGNLTNDGTRQFQYDAENRLVTVSGASSLAIAYDPLGRIQTTTAAGATTRFLYDGNRLLGEYSTGGTALRRYVHADGTDQPLVWYEGAGTSDRHWLIADRQGSIVADATLGAAPTLYTYGPYGEAQTWAGSRFRYTGQIALPQAELYHYKARVYDPKAGRFLQTDPIGYDDDFNLYAYVGNDPLNKTDPTGNSPAVAAPLLCVGPQAVACGIGLGVVTGAALCASNPDCRRAVADAGRAIEDALSKLIHRNDDATPSDRPAGPDGKKGSTGGPGEGKRFKPETPETKAGKEGVPCRYCGEPTTNEPGSGKSRERDHIDPKSRGGNNSPDNEGDACRDCNRGKGAKNPDEWKPPRTIWPF